MGAFCCHGNQSFDPICPKTLCSISPTPVMIHIKFDQDWPTRFRDIQVWKCGRRRRRTKDDGPSVYYKFTLSAFSSCELTNQSTRRKPSTLDRGQLSCHMPTPEFDPGPQRSSDNFTCTSALHYGPGIFILDFCFGQEATPCWWIFLTASQCINADTVFIFCHFCTTFT